MPTGFRVESGADLSERLLLLAPRLCAFMNNQRAVGRGTPDSPITAKELTGIIAKAGFEASTSDIGAIVNYLRRGKQPIGSNGNGYYWAKTAAELEPTKRHLRERISAIRHALDGLEQAFPEQQGELFGT